jgi:hypothetical protein
MEETVGEAVRPYNNAFHTIQIKTLAQSRNRHLHLRNLLNFLSDTFCRIAGKN